MRYRAGFEFSTSRLHFYMLKIYCVVSELWGHRFGKFHPTICNISSRRARICNAKGATLFDPRRGTEPASQGFVGISNSRLVVDAPSARQQSLPVSSLGETEMHFRRIITLLLS